MAHFAKLNENNVVMEVIVVNNNELLVDGIESEDKGITFCKSLYGENTKWKQTSYNANFRKNYAAKNFIYDEMLDAFLFPQPFSSWILNKETYLWEAPVPMPTDGKLYRWNEEIISWVQIEQI